MKMLVINAGSSSLKFTVFDFSWLGKQVVLASGQVECIGMATPHLIYTCGEGLKSKTDLEIDEKRLKAGKYLTHSDALKCVCSKLLDSEEGVLTSITDVIAIGHRVVHGGEKITEPVIVDNDVKKAIKDCFELAPLHNPPNLSGIEACEKIFPGVPNVAIFDTAFHQTMLPEAYVYAIPYELYTKYGIRKYGFHGTSHHYVATATASYLKVAFDEVKLITCHLGNGSSMAAIDKGKVIDTTMGMTPLEGLVMGTRCGDIDPAVVLRMFELGNTHDEIDKILNEKSGLLGIAGINTGDCRDIMQAAAKGNTKAALAIKLFVNRVIKYAGAYSAILNGADGIVFTGGIGEHSDIIRELILEKLTSLGVFLDKDINAKSNGTGPATISTSDSTMKAIVMPTNEELMIAKESIELLLRKNRLRLVAV
jgi:acetate kinase